MAYSAWFQSVSGSSDRYPLNEVLYRCPKTGALLEVQHDLEALRSRSAKEWRELFDQRLGRVEWPYGSGVWGKREWVQPHIETSNIVSLGEGRSALLSAEVLAHSIGLEHLWIKQCGTSHTGSFKDLGMTVLVSSVKQMVSEGKPIRALACASTGDTSAALAAYGAHAQIPVVVLLPKGKISAAQLVQPLAHGALVCALDTDFDGCMRVVQHLTEDPTIYLANSMNSLRVEGQKTIAIEIVQDLDWQVPDWVLVPGGNLGNVSAIAKGFLEMREVGLIDRIPRLACCQAARANPLFLAYQRALRAGREILETDFSPVEAGETLASAIRIGAPVSLPKAVRALSLSRGVVEQATEEELANAAAKADRSGFFTCPHTGVALACLEKLAAGGTIERSDRVVVISTAHGLKFTEFKTATNEDRFGCTARYANHPVPVGSDPAQVSGQIHRLLDERST